jgi:hypothetical protein
MSEGISLGYFDNIDEEKVMYFDHDNIIDHVSHK